MSRKDSREIVFKYIYQMDFNEDYTFDNLDYLIEEYKIQDSDKAFIEKSLDLYVKNKPSIDEKIEKFLVGWTMNRIPKIDLAILRMAINEIDNVDEVPSSVSINEAVDIAKSFSTDESYKFINGLLGSYFKSIEEN